MPLKEIDVTDDTDVVVDPNKPEKVQNTAGFDDLRAQLDSERQKRQDAENRANRDRQEADRARSDAQAARRESTQGRKSVMESTISAKRAALDALEGEMAAAGEAGDFKKMAQLQRKIGEESADLRILQNGVSSLNEDEPEPRRTAGRIEREDPPARKTAADPFEEYVGQFNPQTQQWLRDHPECVTNRTKNSQVVAAHNEALDQGYKQESDAYWAYIERKMGYTADAAKRNARLDNQDNADPDPPRRTDPMRSAPVTRGNGSGSSSRVQLTEDEVKNSTEGTIVFNVGELTSKGNRITKDDPRFGEPIGEYEMAWRKKRMQAEGRYRVPYAD